MSGKTLILLSVLAAACVSLSDARLLDSFRSGGSTSDPSLRKLLASGLESCVNVMDFTDLPSPNTLNNGANDITGSRDECCKKCNDHPDCVAWTRIKFAAGYNQAGECWLRDHVPSGVPCNHCESGIAKSEDEILDKCVADGKNSANTAVRGACAVLTRKCPVRQSARRTFDPTLTPKSLPEVVERTCNILFEDACIRSGFDIAIAANDDCSSILLRGPEPVPDCPDYNAAIDIFKSALERACVG